MSTVEIKPITSVMVMLTNQCPLRCPFCFIDKKESRMSLLTLKRIVDMVINNAETINAVPRIAFFGGEPTMEWDSLIVPITEWIRNQYKKDFNLSMTTNMFLLNEERIKYLVDNNIGCLFSVDGGPKTMAVNRPKINGASSFDVIDRNIDIIVATYPKPHARITVNQATVSNFFNDVLYVTNKGFNQINVLPDIFTEWSDAAIDEFEKQIKLYGDYIIHEYRSDNSVNIFQNYRKNFYLMMLSNKLIKNHQEQSMFYCQPEGRCGFGSNGFVTSDCNGDFYGCLHPAPLTRDSIFYLGNINDGVDTQKTKRLQDICRSSELKGLNCKSCNLAAVCDRGCAPNNYVINHEMLFPPKTWCRFEQILMNDAIRVANVLGEEKNVLFRETFKTQVEVNKLYE